jgi:hypothetical protein
MSTPHLPRVDRRTAIKWMITAAAAATALSRTPAVAAALPSPVTSKGYGSDPDLLKAYRAGDTWPLTMTEAQRHTAAALCGVIIPADSTSPSAASLHVHDFIDEWISAPYPEQTADRPVILEGLAWIDAESQRRFSRDFAQLASNEQTAICDDICFAPKAAPQFASGAKFFARFRDLTASGFYTLPEGTKDIGFVGNAPQISFNGPPAEVLQKLGVTQTVT